MTRQRRRPPLRRCPSCGGDLYSWAEGTACARCRADGADDAAALAEMVRERRMARRAAWASPQHDDPPAAA